MSVKPKHQHRIFLQAFLARRTMRESTAIELYKRVCTALTAHEPTFRPIHPANSSGVIQFMSELSSIVEDVGFNVKRTRDESSKGRWWYTLVNTDAADDAAQTATDMTPLELSYFRELILNILESYPACSLGANEARSIAGKLLTTMNRAHADEVLAALVSRGWLRRSKRGRYTLGTRALAELEPWLKAEFSDVLFYCAVCSKIVTQGYQCGNTEKDCETHFHAACHTILTSNPRAKCPAPDCGLPIAGMQMRIVGEGSVAKARDGDIGMFRKKRTGRRAGLGDEDGDDNEDELEEEVSQSQSQSQSQTQSRSQRATRKRNGATQSQAASQSQAEEESEDDLYDSPPPKRRR